MAEKAAPVQETPSQETIEAEAKAGLLKEIEQREEDIKALLIRAQVEEHRQTLRDGIVGKLSGAEAAVFLFKDDTNLDGEKLRDLAAALDKAKKELG